MLISSLLLVTTVSAAEKSKKDQSVSKRNIAQSQKLNVTEVVSKLGVKNGSEYVLTKGDEEECLSGILRIRGLEDGSISIMVGERVLVYDVLAGDAVLDNSERDCQITVKTSFRASQIIFDETYSCTKRSHRFHKTLNFTSTKNKSILDYIVEAQHGGKKKTSRTIKCRLEA